MRRILIVIILSLIITISSSQIVKVQDHTATTNDEASITQDVVQLTNAQSNPNPITESVIDITSDYNANYDKNQNKIHDSLDIELQREESVLVCYEHFPDDSDVSVLRSLGVGIHYKCKYINVIETEKVPFNMLEEIADLPGVRIIEPLPEMKPLLDISNPAVKARESAEYSPDTAWELGYTGKGITIAVLDTGVDDGHPDLNGKFIAGADFAGAAGLITTKDGSYNPDDETGHGTAVAGIALGTGSADESYRGIAPGAGLIDVRVTLGRGGDIIAALEWCIDNKDSDWNNNGEDDYDGIDIISISVGGSEDSDGTDTVSLLVNQVADAGIVIVTAMGNDGPNNQGVGNVAAADKVIAVGNLDDQNTIDRDDDEVDSSSTRGPRRDDGDADLFDELKPDVVAPGMSITSTEYNLMGEIRYGYSTNSGSSMSCPHVSGITALMLEANQKLRPMDVKRILQETAEAMGEPDLPELSDKYNSVSGFGSVDAYGAVKEAENYEVVNHAPEIISLDAEPKYVAPNGESNITTAALDEDGDALTYTYQATGGELTGTGAQVTWTAPAEVGQYEVTVTVSDAEFTTKPQSVTIIVETEPQNDPPVIEKVIADPTIVEPSESATITVSATDPEDDELFYEYTATGGSISGTGSRVVWLAPDDIGEYTITITVSDYEYSVKKDVTITVTTSGENRAPEIESFSADTRSINTGGTVRLYVKATDPELGKLTYSYFFSAGDLSGSGPNVNWTAPYTEGSYSIDVTVTDSLGLSDEEDISISVFQPNFPPKILASNVYPNEVVNDGTVEVLFTVTVSDLNELGDISKVVIDLTSVSGDNKQKMYDNGKHGDASEDDGVYSYSYLIPRGISGGLKSFPVYVEDYSDESADSFILMEVIEVPEDSSDDGMLGDFLPLPGFSSDIIIMAFIIIFILFASGRFRTHQRRVRNK